MDGTVRPDMLSDQTNDHTVSRRRRRARAGWRPRSRSAARASRRWWWRSAAPAPTSRGPPAPAPRRWSCCAPGASSRRCATPRSTSSGARSPRRRSPAPRPASRSRSATRRPTRAPSSARPRPPACRRTSSSAILEEHLATLPAVRVERGVEIVTRREPRDDGVTVRAAGGRTIRARYLVAADGIRSTVRAALGIARPAPATLAERLAVLLRGAAVGARGRAPPRHLLPRRRGRRRADAAAPTAGCSRSRDPRPSARRPDAPRSRAGRSRGVRTLEPRSSTSSRTTYAVELADALPRAQRVPDRRRRPPLTPRGATGMNTAIRDGYDLGWKLAWVLRGWAGEELLDSYEAERRPVAEHNAARSADPNGSIRGVAEELHVDLGGRIAHAWLPGETGRGVDARPARRRADALHRPGPGGRRGAARRPSPSAGSTPSPPARSGSSTARRCWCGPTGWPLLSPA